MLRNRLVCVRCIYDLRFEKRMLEWRRRNEKLEFLTFNVKGTINDFFFRSASRPISEVHSHRDGCFFLSLSIWASHCRSSQMKTKSRRGFKQRNWKQEQKKTSQSGTKLFSSAADREISFERCVNAVGNVFHFCCEIWVAFCSVSRCSEKGDHLWGAATFDVCRLNILFCSQPQHMPRLCAHLLAMSLICGDLLLTLQN